MARITGIERAGAGVPRALASLNERESASEFSSRFFSHPVDNVLHAVYQIVQFVGSSRPNQEETRGSSQTDLVQRRPPHWPNGCLGHSEKRRCHPADNAKQLTPTHALAPSTWVLKASLSLGARRTDRFVFEQSQQPVVGSLTANGPGSLLNKSRFNQYLNL